MKKAILPIGILFAAVALAMLMNAFEREPEQKEVIETITAVDTVPLTSKDIHFTISSQGNVSPRTETTLISEISGVILTTSPKLVAGGFFKKGEVLLTLDPSDYEVAVQQARANVLSMQAKLTLEEAQAEQAKKEWGLTRRPLSEAPILALRTPYLEEAKANVLFAEADLRRAERKLQLTIFTAPYDGMIKEKSVDVGQYITTGTQVATTFAVDIAEVRLPLTDRDMAFLSLPSPTDLVENAKTKKSDVILTSVIGTKTYQWPGYIVRSEGVIDQQTRVHYAVAQVIDPYGLSLKTQLTRDNAQELDLENSQGNPPLAMGSFVKAKIQGRLMKDTVAIPMQAIRGMDQILLKDENDQLHIKKVDIIHVDDKYAYTQSGNFQNQQAITTAVYNPVEGMPLQNSSESNAAN